VSEATVLIALIRKNPDKKFYVKLLADELQVQPGMERFAALRHAAAIRREVTKANEMADAAELMRADSPVRHFMIGAIKQHIVANFEDGVTVFLVPGSRPPLPSWNSMFTDGEWVRGATVLIGARWIIHMAEEMEIFPARRVSRRAIRPSKR